MRAKAQNRAKAPRYRFTVTPIMGNPNATSATIKPMIAEIFPAPPEAGMTEAAESCWVKTNGMDGCTATFSVYERFQTRKEPRVESKVVIGNNYGFATFHYKQGLGEAAGGNFTFEVKIAKKRAHSDVLTIRPYPLDSVGGVQQRLKELGYDPGETDGVFGPSTERGVRAFQQDNPELVADGSPGPVTKRELRKA
jgi:hypothetical protein